MTIEDKIKNYPKTEFFEVMDTMGVPHPFCISSHHVVHAADNFSGQLGGDAIRSLEKLRGRPTCGVSGCNLMYDEHEQALAVRCRTKDKDLTKAYLTSIVKQCETDGFAGFVLVDGTKEE